MSNNGICGCSHGDQQSGSYFRIKQRFEQFKIDAFLNKTPKPIVFGTFFSVKEVEYGI